MYNVAASDESSFSESLPHYILSLSDYRHFSDCEVVSHALICIPLIINDIEHISYLISYSYILFSEKSKYFIQFLGFFVSEY